MSNDREMDMNGRLNFGLDDEMEGEENPDPIMEEDDNENMIKSGGSINEMLKKQFRHHDEPGESDSLGKNVEQNIENSERNVGRNPDIEDNVGKEPQSSKTDECNSPVLNDEESLLLGTTKHDLGERNQEETMERNPDTEDNVGKEPHSSKTDERNRPGLNDEESSLLDVTKHDLGERKQEETINGSTKTVENDINGDPETSKNNTGTHEDSMSPTEDLVAKETPSLTTDLDDLSDDVSEISVHTPVTNSADVTEISSKDTIDSPVLEESVPEESFDQKENKIDDTTRNVDKHEQLIGVEELENLPETAGSEDDQKSSDGSDFLNDVLQTVDSLKT